MCDHVETGITCRCINRIINIMIFCLIKEQDIDLFYSKGNLK